MKERYFALLLISAEGLLFLKKKKESESPLKKSDFTGTKIEWNLYQSTPAWA